MISFLPRRSTGLICILSSAGKSNDKMMFMYMFISEFGIPCLALKSLFRLQESLVAESDNSFLYYLQLCAFLKFFGN